MQTLFSLRLAFFVSFAILIRLPLYAQDFTGADPESVGLSSERLGRLDNLLQNYVDDGRLPGAALLLAKDGSIVYHKAFGYRDLESQTSLRPDDLFRIASQTKAIISVAVMMLQERGELLISDRLDAYIPEFEDTKVAVQADDDAYEIVDAEHPITLRHLLTHTSGIGYGSGPAADLWEEAGIQGWYFADRDEPIATTVERMAALPIDAQPGEQFVYGYSTDILGVVIERASGRPLDEFLRTEIFEPLRMQDTFFYVPSEKTERLVTVYSSNDTTLSRAPDPGHMVGQGAYLEGPRKSFSGGAGLVSTPGDYARFLEMLRRGGELDDTRLLSPKTVELMTVDHLQSVPFGEGTGFGLGFSVLEDLGDRGQLGSVGEYGWGGAYHSSYWVDPEERLTVVYMTQVIPSAGLDDFAKVRALIYQAFIE